MTDRPLGYKGSIAAFRRVYEGGEHASEREAFFAAMAAAEPFMRVMVEDLRRTRHGPPKPFTPPGEDVF